MKAIVTGAGRLVRSHVDEVLEQQSNQAPAIDDPSKAALENVPAQARFVERPIVAPIDDVFTVFVPVAL